MPSTPPVAHQCAIMSMLGGDNPTFFDGPYFSLFHLVVHLNCIVALLLVLQNEAMLPPNFSLKYGPHKHFHPLPHKWQVGSLPPLRDLSMVACHLPILPCSPSAKNMTTHPHFGCPPPTYPILACAHNPLAMRSACPGGNSPLHAPQISAIMMWMECDRMVSPLE